MAEGKPPFLILSPALQTYAWGRKGQQGEACRLKSYAERDFEVDENQTYAEMWMGTHKKGPSTIRYPESLAGMLLSDWLKDNQWALGDKVAADFDGEFPFLFKVLSINRALSIQAHPDKEHARKLHMEAPDKYPDPNHKPEMVIAMREFEGMCGFRPFPAIQECVMKVLELRKVLGQQVSDTLIALPRDAPPRDRLMVLKLGFTSLMSADPTLVREQLDAFVERVKKEKEPWLMSGSHDENLVCSLNELYPGDVGCFCVFFLNTIHMFAGHALFLPANEPHCYLRGEVIECMACSDNVVRAGLTQKYKDKDTLCEMLHYNSKTFEQFRMHPRREIGNRYSDIYDPPTPEFAVAKVSVPRDVNEFSLPAVSGPSLILMIMGNLDMTVGGVSYNTKRGYVVFVAAGQKIDFVRREKLDILMYRAYCDLQ